MSSSSASASGSPSPPAHRRQPTLGQFVQPPAKPDPNRGNYCGVRLHCLKMANLIALVGLLFAVLRLVFWSLDQGHPQEKQIDGALVHTLAQLIANSLLFCAVWLRMAPLCVPFLLLNPVSLFLLFQFYIVRLFSPLSEWPLWDALSQSGQMAAMAPQERQFASVCVRMTFLLLTFLSAVALLLCWFQMAVFRAFFFIRHSVRRQKEKDVYRNAYCASDPRVVRPKDFY